MMRRRVMPVRRGGVIGTVARTAVIAGTATVTAGAVNNAMQNRAESRAQAQADEQAAFQSQQDVEQMKAQMQQMQAQQAATALGSSGQDDLLSQLERLTKLKDAGALSGAEFDAAKAKLLAG
jgi:tRNA G18 (ribose-2'-O)-methylase SpoU